MLASVIEYVWYFFMYAFLGWCTEVIFATCVRGGFENRGFLNGPVCPIYGFGVVAVILCLEPLKDNLLVLFVGSVIVTSVLELVTGFLMEKLLHHRWWDYSNMPLNIGGYVCLAFSLIWGLACTGLIDIIHPLIKALVVHIPALVSYIALPVLIVTFLVDTAATATSVLHFNRQLEELEKMAAQIHELSDEIGKAISDSAGKIYTSDKVKKIKENVAEIRENAKDRKEKLEDLKEKFEAKIRDVSPIQKRLLRAFPSMKPVRHSESFAKVREAIRTRKDRKA